MGMFPTSLARGLWFFRSKWTRRGILPLLVTATLGGLVFSTSSLVQATMDWEAQTHEPPFEHIASQTRDKTQLVETPACAEAREMSLQDDRPVGADRENAQSASPSQRAKETFCLHDSQAGGGSGQKE